MHKEVGVLGRAGAFYWVPLEKPAFVFQVGKNRKKRGLQLLRGSDQFSWALLSLLLKGKVSRSPCLVCLGLTKFQRSCDLSRRKSANGHPPSASYLSLWGTMG